MSRPNVTDVVVAGYEPGRTCVPSGLIKAIKDHTSTQICSQCGALPPERPRGIADLGMREWECASCGTRHDRDVNAAKNILATGLSAQPPVEESRVAHGC